MRKTKQLCCICRCMKEPTTKLIGFPKDEAQKQVWLNILQMDKDRFKPYMRFCESHLRREQNLALKTPLQDLTTISNSREKPRTTRSIQISSELSPPELPRTTRPTQISSELSPLELPKQFCDSREKPRTINPIQVSSELCPPELPRTTRSTQTSSELSPLKPRTTRPIQISSKLSPPKLPRTRPTQISSELSSLELPEQSCDSDCSLPSQPEIENTSPTQPQISSEHSENLPSTPTHSGIGGKWLRYFGDIKTPDVSTPRGGERCLYLAREAIGKAKKKIKRLESQNHYLKKKVHSLSESLREVRNQLLLTDES